MSYRSSEETVLTWYVLQLQVRSMKALLSSNSTPSASAWMKSSRRRESVDSVIQALEIASNVKMFIRIASRRCLSIQFFSTNFPLNCPKYLVSLMQVYNKKQHTVLQI